MRNPYFQPAIEITRCFFKGAKKALSVALSAKFRSDEKLFYLKPAFFPLHG